MAGGEGRSSDSRPLRHDDVRAYYDDVYFDEGRPFARPLPDYAEKLSWLCPRPTERLLDCSCGAGGVLAVARAAGLDAVGIDLSRRALGYAKRSGEERLACAVTERLPIASKSVDLITCLGSLEHYVDPAAAIVEMCRVLRPGGRMLIVVPNYYYWRNVAYAAVYGAHRTGHHQIVERVDTYRGWRTFLEEHGLAVTAVHRDIGPLPSGRGVHLGTRIRQLTRRAIERLVPLYLTYQFGFVCVRSKHDAARSWV
ncbi:MAG: methyltransferase domain-containing protein [Chloroflexi bacterium]|nr:MAG: methyltransferase domain-containing protein [Chloroflexota bacterium]